MEEIAVITHNPKGEWGDVRPTIESQKYYDWSRKSIGSPKIGQKVLIYISKGIFRIEYIMQISEINDETIRLDLISKIDEEKANLLQFENLVAHGLKRSTVNYVLNNNKTLHQYVMNVLEGQSMKNTKNMPLNQIIYGPPGTGKTYNTITKALEIIDGSAPSVRQEAKAKFEEYRKSGQIEFVTFHQSYGYEEFVEGIRAKTSDKGLEYAIEAGIFKKLTKVAAKNIEQTKENTIIKKDFDVIFKEKILDKLLEDEKLEIKMKKSSFFIKEVDETHIGFDKSGGDSQHVLLIKNLGVMKNSGG